MVDLEEWLTKEGRVENVSLESISFTRNVGRSHFKKRAMLVADSTKELQTILHEINEGKQNSNYAFNLETAIGPSQEVQDFESKSLEMGAEHSQTWRRPQLKWYGSKDCASWPAPIAVSRFNLEETEIKIQNTKKWSKIFWEIDIHGPKTIRAIKIIACLRDLYVKGYDIDWGVYIKGNQGEEFLSPLIFWKR